MLLAPAVPRAKTSQSASRSVLSSQRENDTESATMHYRARSYDPRTGRFVERDPGLGRFARQQYVFARNNPTGYVDPSGKYEIDVHQWLTYYLAVRAGLNKRQARLVAVGDQYTDENPMTEPVQIGARLKQLMNPVVFVAVPAMLVAGLLDVPFEGTGGWVEGASVITSGGVPDVVSRIHFPAASFPENVKAASDHAFRIVDEAFLMAGRSRTAVAPSDDVAKLMVGGTLPDSAFRFSGRRQGPPSDLKYVLLGIGMHSLQDSFSHEDFSAITGHAKNRDVDKPHMNPAKGLAMAKTSFETLRKFAGAGGAQWEGDIKKFVTGFLNTPDKEERIRLIQDKLGISGLQRFDAGEMDLHSQAARHVDRLYHLEKK